MAFNCISGARIDPGNLNNYRFTDAQGYSACGWASTTTLNSSFRAAISKSSTGDATKLMFIGLSGNSVTGIATNCFCFLANGSNSFGIATSTLSINTWYFWVASHTGTTNPDNANLWVWDQNGNLLATTRKGTTGGIDADTSMTCWIGMDFGNNALQWLGPLSNMAVWNCPMSYTEATVLYRGASPNTIRPRNLLFWATLEAINTTMVNRGLLGGCMTASGTWSFQKGPPTIPIRDFHLRNYYNPDLIFSQRSSGRQLRPWLDATVAHAVGSLGQTHYRFRTDASAVDTTPTWGGGEDVA